jgi:hypothetical protein
VSVSIVVESAQVGLHSKGKVLSLKQKTRLELSNSTVVEATQVGF